MTDAPGSGRLALPVVCLVTDGARDASRLDDAVGAAAEGGVTLVQLRAKDLDTRELIARTAELQAILEPLAVPLVVNGRADVAYAAGAAGVHLPADGLPVAAARAVLGGGFLVGASVHSAAEALALADAEADYLILGTIFPSASHPGGSTIGVDAVWAAARGEKPVVAIGGITAATAGAVIAAGASGIAVISAILDAGDPRAAARELSESVNDAWARRAGFQSRPDGLPAVGSRQ